MSARRDPRMRAVTPWLLLAALALPAPAAAQIVRNFTPRFTQNVNGDITLAGNTLMSCNGGGACNNARNGNGGNVDDNDYNMQYVDVDADASTFCSSSATLALPAGATVLWAGLYWGGDSNNAARNTVRFDTPVTASYQSLTATQLDLSGTVYQGFIEVTALVQAGGNGSYTAANVRSTTGSNHFAGWALVVAFSDNSVPPRNLVVFDGFGQVAPGASVNFTVSGFVTPPGGAVNTRLGAVAYEGDLGLTGDGFRLNGVALGDAVNPATNFFNSTISRFGAHVTTKNPNYQNQLGFDADLVTANGILPNGATSAAIQLNSTDDRYYPGVVTFATDLYAPLIEGNSFTKTVTDVNGAPARPGDLLEYTLVMNNTGQDAAIQTVLRDTLPANASYVAGSLSIVSGSNAGAKSDAAGDDQMEYDAAARRVIARLGAGASAAAGGSLAPAAATSARFRVRINSPAPNGSTIANQGELTFNAAQLGTAFTTRSDGDLVAAGFQPTSVTVTSPVMSGYVFEDVNYGGGAGRSLAAAGGVPRPGARAELYDAAGAFLATVNTDATGRYAFDGYIAGNYTVRIVNSTVTSSRPGAIATLVPVQTFRADASSGIAVGDFNRVGGERPALADAAANTTSASLAALTTASATPQSLAPVTLATASVPLLDFGFGFDLIVNVNDSGQGSLRQFLTNAGALGNAGLAQAGQTAGTECSIFMVSDGAAHPGLRAGLANLTSAGVASIAVTSALPAVTDAATRVDGGTQTANVGDTNPGTLGGGGTVGVDALALATVARPEVELRDGAAVALGLDLEAANAIVTGFAITGFGNSVGSDAHANLKLGAAANGARVEGNVLGSRASAFADPGAGVRSGGDNLRAAGADDVIVRGNLIGFASGSGVALAGGADRALIEANEIRGNSIGSAGRDGVSLESSSAATVRANRIVAHDGAGVDAVPGGGAHVIENNSITGNGVGVSPVGETPGIRIGGAGSRVDRNVISGNYGAGVLVFSSASGNLITRNSISGNGAVNGVAGAPPTGQIGIDLLAGAQDQARGTAPFVTVNDLNDGDAGGNGLLNFPVIESALLSGGNLTLTGWARAGSAIELFVANADPSGFGEGWSYAATVTEGSAADLDATSSAYAGLINGLAQGTDNTNRFRFTIPAPAGVVSGMRLTATGTVAGSTSEFSGLVTVGGGVTVSGFAYADLDHDGMRDAIEPGTGVAVWAKLVASGAPAASQVTAVNAASGAFAFSAVAAGSYAVLLDDNAAGGDVTPALPAGWNATEAPGGTRAVTVAGVDLAGVNFGLWHGSRVSGRAFRDDGALGATANDGVAQPGESGEAGIEVRLESAACATGACDSVLTDGAGAFALWLPFAAAGANASVIERNPSGVLSTGGGAGTTGGSYARASDAVTFAALSGIDYTGLGFGDVPANAFAPNGTQSVAPGGVAFYAHTFVAGSAGSVSFPIAQTPSPAIPGWGVALYRDLNCDATLDPGEPAIAAPLAVAAGQSVCVIARHVVPAGAPAGATEQLAIAAAFDYTNASPALSSAAGVTDLTVAGPGAGGLVLLKSADLATARPGDVITYTLDYSNPGPTPLSAIVIQDATPAYTTFEGVSCGTLGPGLTSCGVSTQPAVGAAGPVQWTLAGALAPGGGGSVSFRVRVR